MTILAFLLTPITTDVFVSSGFVAIEMRWVSDRKQGPQYRLLRMPYDHPLSDQNQTCWIICQHRPVCMSACHAEEDAPFAMNDDSSGLRCQYGALMAINVRAAPYKNGHSQGQIL